MEGSKKPRVQRDRYVAIDMYAARWMFDGYSSPETSSGHGATLALIGGSGELRKRSPVSSTTDLPW